jgi:hypothetical protein
VTNAANSVTTRRVTADILRNQAPAIPPTTDHSPHRRGHALYDDDVVAQSSHGDNSASRNDVGNDMLSESSRDNSIEDPFTDSGEDDVEGKVAQLEQQLADVKERLNQAKMELALEQSRRPIVYDDSYFINQLYMLRKQIQDWTVTYFSHAGGHWTKKAERRFRKLSDDWAAYMDDSGRRPRLIQARIWRILQQLLFDPDSKRQFSYIFSGRLKNYSVDRVLEQGLSDLFYRFPEDG